MIYENIRNLREDNDKKQRELAEYLYVSQNTYSKYENGVLSLSPETLIKLAEFYNTSIDYLLGLTNEKKPYKRVKK
ncbi:helix-turn-helix domain-containing protein [Porcipelethomonas ammoniilytica]|uniref:helix-turn-helix domain-containing protein n=1 Tax=Porcipelethomonas ammoniilytica TaxID=2981722 RepID=UPI0015B06ECD|nr:helix-turn-helix transcriptional regulator [Porcipelethomonas ammoniilytica]MCU6720230.1 helix-turn-helix domain-containing protein [Porcipelethomonas ammoniilytica]